jgi:glycosyltransferase involved in cell wall biosynthesis
MKILIVNCVYDPEPVVSAQIGKCIAEKLEQNFHKVTVICPYPSRPNGFKFHQEFKFDSKIKVFVNKPYLKVLRFPSLVFPKSNFLGRLLEGISFGLHSYNYIKKNAKQFDIVYMNTWPLFGQLGVALACKSTKTQYIVHVQDLYPESFINKLPNYFSTLMSVTLMPIEKYILRNASEIVVISHYMKSKILSRGKINDHKISIIYNWQDDKIYDSQIQNFKDNKCLTFMYLGNIGPVANIPFLIKSFFESKINANLIIAGTGSKKNDCIKLVELLDISNVQFLDVPAGFVPQTQSMADILILSTVKSGAKSSIPSKLPSYMFSKKPILGIVDKDTDSYNAIVSSGCGWVVNPEEKTEIMQFFKMINLVPKIELTKMGMNGYRYAKENYSMEINLEKITNIILKNDY